MSLPSKVDQASVRRLLQACAEELVHARQRLLQLENTLAPALMSGPGFGKDTTLQEALQEFDWISQHLQQLEGVLAKSALEALITSAICETVTSVSLNSVAVRMARSVSREADLAADDLSTLSEAV